MSANQAALKDASSIQRDTREALRRIQQQAAETQAVGESTLTELEEQDRQLDRVTDETGKLHEKLNKTKKLQDRFANWGLQFGTRRAAKKNARKERKQDKEMEKFSKSDAREDTTVATGEVDIPEQAKGIDEDKANRNELFGKKGKRTRKTRPKKKSPPEDVGEALTNEDQAHLDQINAEEDGIDAELDMLGDQMDNLMAMAKTMGDEASKQNKKLGKTTDDMYDASKKQQVANQRARLFTTTRREKRNERNIEKKAKMAAKLVTS